jgi:hypothetical protein
MEFNMKLTRRGLFFNMAALAAVSIPAVSIASQIVPEVLPVAGTALDALNVRRLVSAVQQQQTNILRNKLFECLFESYI